MICWIPINLPWRTYNSDARLEVRRLSDEYEAWFAARVLTLFGPKNEQLVWSFERWTSASEACPDTLDWADAAVYNAFVTGKTDADVLIVAARLRRRALQNNFEDNSPECQEWLRRIEAAVARVHEGQFCNHPMCRPGTALKVRSPTGALRSVLIGDVDDRGYDLATPAIADDDVVVQCADLRPLIEGPEGAPSP